MQQMLPYLPPDLMMTMTMPRNQSKPNKLQPRDVEIVKAVYDYRALTAPQIERLLWYPDETGRRVNMKTNYRCLHRLKVLAEQEHFLYRADVHLLTRGKQPFVYFLWKEGAQYLVDNEMVDALDWNQWRKDIKEHTLVHYLLINDVRIEITLSALHNEFELETWIDEPTLKRDHVGIVVPDSYFVLVAREMRYWSFLEIDRATETGLYTQAGRRDWGKKIEGYLTFKREGIYQKMYHSPGFQVLTVTTGEKRLANLKAITESKGGKGMFLFTTFEQALSSDILTAPIWRKAASDGLHSLT